MKNQKLMPIPCGMRNGTKCHNTDKCIYKSGSDCVPALNSTNPTKSDIIKRFTEYNREHGITYGLSVDTDASPITAVIVYAQSNFKKPYTETQRSYRVDNTSGKIFFDGLCGTSMFGDCLDGTDKMLRLDWQNWKIERCYFE